MPVQENLVAPCGLYCGKCPLFLANVNEALAQSLAEQMKTTPDRAKCPGCRPAAGSPMPLQGKVCETYHCTKEKGLFLCGECASFPCPRLAPTADLANFLPHNTKIFNLLSIRRDGLELWAEQYPMIMSRYFQGKLMLGAGPQLPKNK